MKWTSNVGSMMHPPIKGAFGKPSTSSWTASAIHVTCRPAWLANARSMEDEAVQQLAREGYADLRSDVDGELPAFEDAFGAVSSLYGSLPW